MKPAWLDLLVVCQVVKRPVNRNAGEVWGNDTGH